MRQIILDTETTGLEVDQGHRIVEIGCIELIGRRMTGNNFHQYLNPGREIDAAAAEVHGITQEQLADKPGFADIATTLSDYLKGAELIIHNAPFDTGFINHEFELAGYGAGFVQAHCSVLDTLLMARNKHPGQKNSLDALCKRYAVDNSQRTLHGALLDAEILADVYLRMTGGQTTLLGESEDLTMQARGRIVPLAPVMNAQSLPIVEVPADDTAMHTKWLELLRRENNEGAVWDKNQEADL